MLIRSRIINMMLMKVGQACIVIDILLLIVIVIFSCRRLVLRQHCALTHALRHLLHEHLRRPAGRAVGGVHGLVEDALADVDVLHPRDGARVVEDLQRLLDELEHRVPRMQQRAAAARRGHLIHCV